VAADASLPPPLEAVAPEPPRGPAAVAARRILDRIGREQGRRLATAAALWGYESVRVVLDAIVEAQRGGGPADRAGVVRAALRPRVRHARIGTYTVRRNGGVDGLPLALYRLQGDRLEYVHALP
jgi:hypothetical protein